MRAFISQNNKARTSLLYVCCCCCSYVRYYSSLTRDVFVLNLVRGRTSLFSLSLSLFFSLLAVRSVFTASLSVFSLPLSLLLSLSLSISLFQSLLVLLCRSSFSRRTRRVLARPRRTRRILPPLVLGTLFLASSSRTRFARSTERKRRVLGRRRRRLEALLRLRLSI